jgi:signal transduction histidine kinase
MSLSRIEAEKYDPPQTPVDFSDIVRETVDQLRNSQKDRGTDIVVDMTAGLPPVIGDAGQLRQLASNILNNALKYGRTGTPVTVLLGHSRSGAMISFSVTDVGEGIAPEVVQALAEGRRPDYQRADEALVHDFTQQSLQERRVSDATWAACREVLGEQGGVDLMGIVGYYTMLSIVMNAAQTPPPADRPMRLAQGPSAA